MKTISTFKEGKNVFALADYVVRRKEGGESACEEGHVLEGIDRVDLDEAIEIMMNTPQREKEGIALYLLSGAVDEIAYGLGLKDVDSLAPPSPFFGIIDGLYEKATHGCYFCSRGLDPNETEFNSKSTVCPTCILKLSNFLKAIGVPPELFWKIGGGRLIQKTKVKPKGYTINVTKDK